ncbi:hypothetical protein MRX96_004681 [Rhipicephalus microplus]
MLTGAWWNVKTPTIRNCWRKAGLIKAPAQVEDNLEEDHSNPGDLWTEIEELLPDVSSFDDYVESNSAALTSADMTTEEIVNSIRDVSSDDDDDPKEEDSVSPNTEEDETISHSDMQVKLKELQAKLQDEEGEKKLLEQKYDEESRNAQDVRTHLESRVRELEGTKLMREDYDRLKQSSKEETSGQQFLNLSPQVSWVAVVLFQVVFNLGQAP